MDKTVKRKWIKALRSGKYKQTRGRLLNEKTGGMCCIGVLCRTQGADDDVLLKNWSKLYVGKYTPGLDTETAHVLATLNDEGKRFTTIADYIEKHL